MNTDWGDRKCATSGCRRRLVATGNAFHAKGSLNHAETAKICLPIFPFPSFAANREIAKELEKYPNVEFGGVADARIHVRWRWSMELRIECG